MDDDSALVEAKRLPWNVDLQFSSLARREVDLECSSDHADAFRYSAATQNSSSKPGRTTCPEDSISKTLRER